MYKGAGQKSKYFFIDTVPLREFNNNQQADDT